MEEQKIVNACSGFYPEHVDEAQVAETEAG